VANEYIKNGRSDVALGGMAYYLCTTICFVYGQPSILLLFPPFSDFLFFILFFLLTLYSPRNLLKRSRYVVRTRSNFDLCQSSTWCWFLDNDHVRRPWVSKTQVGFALLSQQLWDLTRLWVSGQSSIFTVLWKDSTVIITTFQQDSNALAKHLISSWRRILGWVAGLLLRLIQPSV